MRCKDCIYWVESPYAYRRESAGDCHLEQKTIPKDGDDFCSYFTSNNKGGEYNENI